MLAAKTQAVSGINLVVQKGMPDASISQAFALFSLLGIVAVWIFIKAMREAVA